MALIGNHPFVDRRQPDMFENLEPPVAGRLAAQRQNESGGNQDGRAHGKRTKTTHPCILAAGRIGGCGYKTLTCLPHSFKRSGMLTPSARCRADRHSCSWDCTSYMR